MSFDINIVAGEDKDSSHVSATGSVQHVITDQDRTTFNVGDNELKQAVNVAFGKRPNDAYLRSPTPWGDLYKRYSWPQVQTVTVVESAEILSVTLKPVQLKTQTFTNSSSHTATFNVGITETVGDTTTSSWTTGHTLTLEQKITYKVGFLGTGGGGETGFSYSEQWGVGGQESKSITLGSTSAVSVTLDPGESVVAELSASRGVMKVRITYKSYLTGVTAVNYNPTFKGHHFWALDIGRVMSSGKISNSVVSTEDIEIDYYSSAKIEVKDGKTGARKAYMIF